MFTGPSACRVSTWTPRGTDHIATEREVMEEWERGRALAELRRRSALEVALEAQALELVPVREDVGERVRVAREDALEVEVREAPDRRRLGGEAPLRVVQTRYKCVRFLPRAELTPEWREETDTTLRHYAYDMQDSTGYGAGTRT